MQVRVTRPRPVVAVNNPAAGVVAATEPASVLAPVARRLRHPLAAQNAAVQAEDAKRKIRSLLQSISLQHAVIDAAKLAVDTATAEIDALMRSGRISKVDGDRLRAELQETSTRQSTKINVARFRAAVPNDVFWQCAEVPVGKAKEHLGTKELNEVSDVTPSVSTGHQLRITEIKTVVKRS
jgi:hypothetical protein